MNQIFHEDCLTTMGRLRDGSVNLIVTSPPYANKRGKQYQTVKADAYVEWFLPMAQEMKRVLAPNGSLVLNIKECAVEGERHTYVLDLIKAMRAIGWLWTEEYIWHKKSSYPGKWPNRFRDSWERLLHFTREKRFTMNQQEVMVPAGDWGERRLKKLSERDLKRVPNGTGNHFAMQRGNWADRKLVYPDNVLHLASETRNVGHPAAFPLALPLWFIKLLSNPGDLVYDPFMGSGTTAIAAASLNRRYLGSELSLDYYHLALERIATAQLGLAVA